MSLLSATVSSIVLLPPRKTSDCAVFTALEHRRTIRDIGADKLPPQLLSNLLWAAYGVNRSAGPFETSGRTAASASNSQEIDVYVAMEEGTFLYEAEDHRLSRITDADLRAAALTPGQDNSGSKAPVVLIYAADMRRLEYTRGYREPGLQDPEVQKSYYYVDTGLIAGNVYLFAAAEGLAAWFHNCDRSAIARKLKLREGQHVLFAQSVGYPDGE